MEKAWEILLLVLLAILCLFILLALVRTIIGPRTVDRAMGINMISTLSIMALADLAVLLKEVWLMDTALIYAALGFLAVVVLAVTRGAAGKLKREEHRDE